MCGILAILRMGHSTNKSKALRQLELIQHRGPDSVGHYTDENCFIGQVRLAMVGINSGFQPLYNKERTICLVANGEIYNYKDIKQTLLETNPEYESQFQTSSDCEVIIFLYKKFGKDFMKKSNMNGMFGFVLYDIAEDIFVVARDAIGMIPLYVGTSSDGSVWYCSEFKALEGHCTVG